MRGEPGMGHGRRAKERAEVSRRGSLSVVGAVLCALALLALPAAASAKPTHLLIEPLGGATPPDTGRIAGLAVDQSTGDVLVITTTDPVHHPIPVELLRFHADGTPAPFAALGTNAIDAKAGPEGPLCAEEPASCDRTPENGFSFGTFPGEAEIAVDNSCALHDPPLSGLACEEFDPANGDIYVAQRFGSGRPINVFAPDGRYLGQLSGAGGSSFTGACGVAVDPGGDLFVADGGEESKFYRFTQPAAPHDPLTVADGTLLSSSPLPYSCSLAAGAGPSAGSLFAAGAGEYEGVSVLDLDSATGALRRAFNPSGRTVSVDPRSGHLFVVNNRKFSFPDDPAADLLNEYSGQSLLSTLSQDFGGVAVDGDAQRMYVAGYHRGVDVRGPLVTIPDVASGAYEVTGNTSATVNGTVDPDGQELTACRFEWGLAEPSGEAEPYEHADPCAESPAEVGSGHGAVAVHAELSGLAPEATYHYRLVAENANAALYPDAPEAVVKGADKTLQTPTKPAIEDEWTASAAYTEARVEARINPGNAETTYRVEWGADAGYGEASAERTVASGRDTEEHTVGVDIAGLVPGRIYHFRVYAHNAVGGSYGEDRSFTTFALPGEPPDCPANRAYRSGPSAALPDCRAYELVSPLNKDGGDVIALGEPFSGLPAVLRQSSLSGERLAYGSFRAFGDAESAPYTSQYVAARTRAGWASHAISPPAERATVEGFDRLDTEYRLFSPDLCDGWLVTVDDPPLAPGGVAGNRNLYRRHDSACGGEGYEALGPVPGFEPGRDYLVEMQGASADGSRTLLAATEAISAGAPAQPPKCSENLNNCVAQLYLHVKEQGLRFVCVLPDGSPYHDGDCVAGWSSSSHPNPRTSHLQGAISDDGERVFWTGSKGRIYLREHPARSESEREHGAAAGSGDLIGPVQGSGNLLRNRVVVRGATPSEGSFAVGQQLTAPGGELPPETEIVDVEEPDPEGNPGVFTLTLDKAPTQNHLGAALVGAASDMVSNAAAESGAFEVGQAISSAGGGIPDGATVVAVEGDKLTLSAPALASEAGAPLSATSPCTEPERACTVPVSEAAEAASETSGSSFWAAAADGSKAIFTTGTDLYEFDVGAGEARLIAGGVRGVAGVSADASRVYFVSTRALAGGALAGRRNLYLHEAGEGGGSLTFVATLASSGDIGVAGDEPRKRSSRVSPDGAHLAFVSAASPTGYDNADVASGKADAEVYLFDAEADGGAGRLLCVSCNPSGARPAGATVKGVPTAAQLPFWQNNFYPGRALSEDGSRLYFESYDALTPRDTNARQDVYQWEASGAGGCDTAAATFSAAAGGCIDLISSGQGAADAEFVDASPSGKDVFFATASSLVSRDYGLIDIYDARVGGGFAAPSGVMGCEGEACQNPAGAPQGPSPASATYSGPGNPSGAPSPFARCNRAGRRARAFSTRARRLRRAAARMARRHRAGPRAIRRARRLRRTARRYAKGARRQSGRAKRCRARARTSGRAGR